MGLAKILQNLSCLAALAVVCVTAAVGAPATPLDPNVRIGSWIWAAETHNRQECRFVRSFQIPRGASVRLARLRITADNSYELFLDGQAIGRGGDWRAFIEYDVRLFITPGEHVLAVSAVNDFDVAGLIAGLRIEMENGGVTEIVTDASWKVAPNNEYSWKQRTRAWNQWPAARVLYSFPAPPPKQVYHAPTSLPIEVALWQRGWVQISLLLVAVASSGTGLFLASRLILRSQMDKVIRRERARIAVDLHDGLGGGLTQLVLFGEKSRRDVPGDSLEAATLARMCGQSRDLLREMNETVWLINSQRDTFRDFASYVVKHAETFFQNSPIRCRFDIEEDLPPLPCDLGTRRNLFLAVKEALNNILKHSQATIAEVGIHRQRQELIVTIRDDGQGFNPATTSGGNGLRNMEQRALEAGGQFKAVSRTGNGSIIEFRVPLHAPAHLGLTRLFSWKSNIPSA